MTTRYQWLADDANGGFTGKRTLDFLGCSDLKLAIRTPPPKHMKEWLEAMGLETAKLIEAAGWYCVCGDMPPLNPPPGT